MKRRHRSASPHQLVVEITPMIDVVFLLIIFFMVTARFAKETRADLELPVEAGEQQEVAEEAGVVVNLTAEGTIIINGEERDLIYLEAVINEEIRKAPGASAAAVRLTVRADRRASTAHLNQVLTTLRRLGIGSARMGTEVPN